MLNFKMQRSRLNRPVLGATNDPRQEWATPPDFWAAVNDEFRFELDACATAENTKVPECFWSPQTDGLAQIWSAVTWCNPGFSNVRPWLRKAIEQAIGFGESSCIVVMGLVSPSTEWWNCEAMQASEIRFLRPRVQFVAPPGIKQSSNPRECALYIYRWNPHRLPPHIWTWPWKEK